MLSLYTLRKQITFGFVMVSKAVETYQEHVILIDAMFS